MNRNIERITLIDKDYKKRASLDLRDLNSETRESIFQAIIRDIGSCGYTRKIEIILEDSD